MTYPDELLEPARARRAAPLLAAPAPVTPHHTPVPTPAHPTDRAIRVLRSPR
ncbi:hypothetical protein GCM10010383_66220 [Streptomyces lomondensis]|uniref:Uncharacterized protein n=1 Tax=Streptomyces lomondensis TaxID=68229 RepID=A0ABQ2XQ04_9ACTN|nr:hypothetical protein GCM10010383_66220 [Streptomyces lomondensis]